MLQYKKESGETMKKLLTGVVILGGIAAAVAYKLKKDEEHKKMLDLELDLLEDEIAEGVEEAKKDNEPASNEEEPPVPPAAPSEPEVPAEEKTEETDGDEYPFLDSDTRTEIDTASENVYHELLNEGDQADEERPIQHFVDFKTEEDLNAFRKNMIEKGYVVTSGENQLDITVLHIAPLDRTKLVSHIYYIANQALRHSGNYKGWKSRVTY